MPCSVSPQFWLVLALFNAGLLGLPWAVDAAPTAKVQLASGRSFTAEIDPKTDAQTLWLAFRAGPANVQRPVLWSRVVKAEYAGKTLSGAELKSTILRDLAEPLVTVPAAATQSIEEPLTTPPIVIQMAQPGFVAVPKVVAVQVSAHYANWDTDVEADGLIVHVQPIGDAGEIVPVDGSIQAELLGVRRIPFNDGPQKRGLRFERLGHWTRQVKPIDCTGSGVWFKLPFQAAQPEFEPSLAAQGLLNVRLVVPGQGVYSSSVDGVRLRPFAPLRDTYQLNTGRRFFPFEVTGRAKRN